MTELTRGRSRTAPEDGRGQELCVYFIKLSDNTWGIVGFEPRAKQDEFLRTVRVKIKPGKQDPEE